MMTWQVLNSDKMADKIRDYANTEDEGLKVITFLLSITHMPACPGIRWACIASVGAGVAPVSYSDPDAVCSLCGCDWYDGAEPVPPGGEGRLQRPQAAQQEHRRQGVGRQYVVTYLLCAHFPLSENLCIGCYGGFENHPPKIAARVLAPDPFRKAPDCLVRTATDDPYCWALILVCVCGSVEPGRAGHGRQGARVHADLEKEHDEPGTHALQPSRHVVPDVATELGGCVERAMILA